jgi:RNA polymerase sigma factor (sigma-70 family)
VKEDLTFIRLLDTYAPLLTATQREIADLYFNYDLSLGEIAEQKGVSRQSVSDCLQKCRKQVEKYEEKLGFLKTVDEMQAKIDSLQQAEGK